MAPPEDFPISGLCVVADPTKCPPGYEVYYRSYDKGEDCDLWKDSFFRARVTRYLCYTRVYPLDGGRLNNVLADVVLNNEREPPPPGFSLIDITLDTREKATRKKQICVKMLPRESTKDAINELIVLSKNKRPPTGYTLVGEMNGLLICFKMGRVPEEMETSNGTIDAQSAPNSHAAPQEAPATNSPAAHNKPYQGYPGMTSAAPQGPVLKKQDSLIQPSFALQGVPFQLSSKFTDVENLRRGHVPDIQYRSLVDIDNEYSYSFTIERTATERMPPDLE